MAYVSKFSSLQLTSLQMEILLEHLRKELPQPHVEVVPVQDPGDGQVLPDGLSNAYSYYNID